MSSIDGNEWKSRLQSLKGNWSTQELVDVTSKAALSIPELFETLSHSQWKMSEQVLAEKLVSVTPIDARSSREYQLFVLQLQKRGVLDEAHLLASFSFACEQGDDRFAIRLIEGGLGVLGETAELSPLHQAIRCNRLEVLRAADNSLNKGIQGWKNYFFPPQQALPEKDVWGDPVSPITYACRHGSDEVLSYLMDTRGLDGEDPFDLLVESILAKQQGSLRVLLDDLDWEPLTQDQRERLVQTLIESRDSEILTALLEKDLLRENDLIDAVCEIGGVEMLKEVLDLGADPNFSAPHGASPLFTLIMRGLGDLVAKEMVALLLQSGADLSKGVEEGSLFQLAARNGQAEALWSIWLEVFGEDLKQSLGGQILGAGEILDWPENSLPYFLRPSLAYDCIELVYPGEANDLAVATVSIKGLDTIVDQVEDTLMHNLILPSLEKEGQILPGSHFDSEGLHPLDVLLRVDSAGREIHLDYFDFEGSTGKRETFSAFDLVTAIGRYRELRLQQKKDFEAEFERIKEYAGERWMEDPRDHRPRWGDWCLGLEEGGEGLWFTAKNAFCTGHINVVRPNEFSLAKVKELEEELERATLAWRSLKGCYSASLLEPNQEPSSLHVDPYSTQNVLIQPSEDYSYFKLHVYINSESGPRWVVIRTQGLDDVLEMMNLLYKLNEVPELVLLDAETHLTAEIFAGNGWNWMFVTDNPDRGYPLLHYFDPISGEVLDIPLSQIVSSTKAVAKAIWKFRQEQREKLQDEVDWVVTENAHCLKPNTQVVRDPQTEKILGMYSFEVIQRHGRAMYQFRIEGIDLGAPIRTLEVVGRESFLSFCQEIQDELVLAKRLRELAKIPGIEVVDPDLPVGQRQQLLSKGIILVSPGGGAKNLVMQAFAPDSKTPITLVTQGLADCRERLKELEGFRDRLQAWKPDLKGLNRPAPPNPEVPPVEEEVDFSNYLKAFDSLNFSDANKEGYRDPDHLYDGGMRCSVQYLRDGVKSMVTMLKQGSGASGIPDDRVKIYEEMQLFAKHILLKLPDLDPDMQASLLIDFAKMGTVCGPQRRLDLRISYALVSGNFNSVGDQNFDGQMLQLRDSVTSSVIEQMMWESGTEQPEHVMNYIRECLDFEGVVLPEVEKELMEGDPWAHTYGFPLFGESDEVWKCFQKRYWIALIERIHEDANRRIQQEGPGFISLLEQVLLDFVEEHYLSQEEKQELETILDPLRGDLHEKMKAAQRLGKIHDEQRAKVGEAVWNEAEDLAMKRDELKMAVSLLKRAPENEILKKRSLSIQTSIQQLELQPGVHDAALLQADLRKASKDLEAARTHLEDAKRQTLAGHLQAAQLIKISKDRRQAELLLDGALAMARQFGFVEPKAGYGKTWFQTLFGKNDKGEWR